MLWLTVYTVMMQLVRVKLSGNSGGDGESEAWVSGRMEDTEEVARLVGAALRGGGDRRLGRGLRTGPGHEEANLPGKFRDDPDFSNSSQTFCRSSWRPTCTFGDLLTPVLTHRVSVTLVSLRHKTSIVFGSIQSKITSGLDLGKDWQCLG